MQDLIAKLDNDEKKWWQSTIKEFRGSIVKEPKHYALRVLERRGITAEHLKRDPDHILMETREEVWEMYLQDEARFHADVLAHLVKTRDVPREILAKVLESEVLQPGHRDMSKQEMTELMARIIGEYAGRIMPYIYELSLSSTQSRRSRAGKVFEHIIETFMTVLGYPYGTQSSIGTSFFHTNRLGKKVDLIVPGADEYIQNRSKCAVVTMKTSLRERWQEVAEELSRTNIPHIYLLTVDRALTANVINTMQHYNITVVLYESEKREKFSEFDTVQSFKTFFLEEMPHIISYWNRNL